MSKSIARPSVARLFSAGVLALAAVWFTAPAAAQSSGLYADETYSFYSTHDESYVQEGAARRVTWKLHARFRAFSSGTISRDSMLRFELRQGTRRIMGMRCRPEISGNRITVAECWDGETPIRETGELTVVWFFINGDDDAETQLASHAITVRELPVYTRAVPPVAADPHIIIDRHAEVLSAFVFQGEVQPAQIPEFAFPSSNVYLQFSATTGPEDAFQGASVRCRLNGARVEIPNARIFGRAHTEELDSAWMPVAGATVPNLAAAEEYVRFRRYVISLPLMVPPIPADTYSVANRVPMTAGAWECDLRSGEQVTLRTFRWNVGADGLIAAHAEETEGGLRLPPGVHFVESVFPAEAALDTRTDPTAVSRALYGRGLRSAAARALTVPAVGVPYPVAPRAAAGRTSRPRR